MYCWIEYKRKTAGAKILERKSFFICEDMKVIFPGISVIADRNHKIINMK